MYCTNCGTAVLEGAAFCRNCGQPVVAAHTVASETAESPSAVGLLPATKDATIPPTPPVPPPVVPAIPPVGAVAGEFDVGYAGFWLRVVAYLIDSAILGVAFGAVV